MKIMVCGKGGSGKSAVSVLMARALPKKRVRPSIVSAYDNSQDIPEPLEKHIELFRNASSHQYY